MSFKITILSTIATSFVAVVLSVNFGTILQNPLLLTLGLATIGSLSVSSVYIATKAESNSKAIKSKMEEEFGQVKATLSVLHGAIKELKITKKDKQYK